MKYLPRITGALMALLAPLAFVSAQTLFISPPIIDNVFCDPGTQTRNLDVRGSADATYAIYEEVTLDTQLVQTTSKNIAYVNAQGGADVDFLVQRVGQAESIPVPFDCTGELDLALFLDTGGDTTPPPTDTTPPVTDNSGAPGLPDTGSGPLSASLLAFMAAGMFASAGLLTRTRSA